MKALRQIILILVFCVTAANSIQAQWAVTEGDADSLIRLGSEYIYNVQFDNASDCFEKVIKMQPNHPAGYFLNAMVDYWKITLFRNTRVYDDKFLKKIDRVLAICDKMLDTNEFNLTALFFKGGALGYRGRYHGVRHNWLSAASDGKTAYDIFIQCQNLAPNNHDIMLGTGIFNYFTEAIPEKYTYLKPLLYFLPKGNKRIGIWQLEAASRQARYSATEAKVVLLQIFYQFEENYSEALKVAEELCGRYPNNPYFHRYLGRCYVTTGNMNKWEQTWRDILLRFIDNQPGYDDLTAREALYYVVSSLFKKGDLKMAKKYFLKCEEASEVLDKEEDSGFRVNANLYLGKICDRLDQRQEAISYYNKVLGFDEFRKSHTEAKAYIKKPFK